MDPKFDTGISVFSNKYWIEMNLRSNYMEIN